MPEDVIAFVRRAHEAEKRGGPLPTEDGPGLVNSCINADLLFHHRGAGGLILRSDGYELIGECWL